MVRTLTPLVAFFGFLGSAPAADEGTNLAAELARLRGEVETLSAQLDTDREDLRSRLRSLATQKTDLEMELSREELRLKQLREARARQRARVERTEQRKNTFKPIVSEAIGIIRAAVTAGLPFQAADRQAELDKLSRQLDDGTMTTPTVLTRLWGKVEDEFRLARETGLYRQVIQLRGEEVLAEVARVGMVMMYFSTRDGRYGRVRREGKGWTYELYQREEDIRRVVGLYDALKKRIRTGYFELPPALALEGDR